MTIKQMNKEPGAETPPLPRQWPEYPLADPGVEAIYGDATNMVSHLAQQQFVRQGSMVALPLGFPGVSLPLPRGECAITALAMGPGREIYGLTGGRRSHLFCAMTHAATGFVHMLDTFDDLNEGVAVGIGADGMVYACLNGPRKSCLVRHNPQNVPFDCLQEWVLYREPSETVMTLKPGEKFVHAVLDSQGKGFFAQFADGRLVWIDIASGDCESLAQIDALGHYGRRLILNRKGILYGTGFGGSIWCYDAVQGHLEKWPQAIACAPGREGYNDAAGWACDPRRHWLYVSSSADGTLSVLDCEARTVRSLGQIDAFSPAMAMAVTHDGRLFGVAGGQDDVGRLFVHDPDRAELRDLGVCVSVLGARVYGFVFEVAITGPDGEIYFGEADNISHLWTYYPAIRALPSE